MIQVQNLRRSFHQRAVVKDLSFQANDGAITGLLGANGAGKTTTLRMITGLLKPDSGDISINGIESSANLFLQQRQVGALLDHIGVYPRLTARENIAYFGKLRGLAPKPLQECVNQVIATLGIQSLADRRAAGFSQGELMKTALGRALLHSPNNLLLDEPTNGLDVTSVRMLRDLLRRLRDSGTCILFSSHVLEEVRALCDHVVIIAEGRIAAQGSPKQLCAEAGTTSLEEAFVKFTSTVEATC